jgi:hypothetical protein
MGLMTAQYTKNTMKLTQLWGNYYQAYYRAYWWIEYGLAQIAHHWFWYESTISWTWSCLERTWCGTQVQIQGRFYRLDGTLRKQNTVVSGIPSLDKQCSQENAWILKSWEWLVIPLFYDGTKPFWSVATTPLTFREIQEADITLESVGEQWTKVNVRIVDDEWIYMASWRSWPTGSKIALGQQLERALPWDKTTNEKFLVIRWEEGEIGICLSSKLSISSPIITIEAMGKAGQWALVLTAKKNAEVPSYLLYGIITQ